MNVYVALDLLAKAVREAREERGLSQRELARKLSMNTRTIMDLEICRSNPKGETIFLIARELHISFDASARQIIRMACPRPEGPTYRHSGAKHLIND